MYDQAHEPLDNRLQGYLQAVRLQSSHTGKVIQFVRFIEDIFQIPATEYVLEQRADDTRLQVHGRIDTVVGDTLFEFKTNLNRELNEAEIQLRGYLGVFHNQNPKARCVGIATDGVQFCVYQPSFTNGALPDIRPLERQDFSRLSGEQAVLWLDRYLFRRTPRSPTEDDISSRFGAGSPTYNVTMFALRSWWDTVKSEPSAALRYEVWQTQLTVVYGEGLGNEDLFLRHTYLATLAKLFASLIFRSVSPANELDVLTGAYFSGIGIENFVEEDLFSWMLHPNTQRDAVTLLSKLRSQLEQYDPSGFTEDLLKGLYQQLVDPQDRHQLGEFYTPDWLAEEMLRQQLGSNATIRLLDPACGSGTFLFLAIRLITELLRKRGWVDSRILEHIQSHVTGVDVHPLPVLIARTNYLIAAAPLLTARTSSFTVPVYLGDSLRYGGVVHTMLPLEIEADHETLQFPTTLAVEPGLFDEIVTMLVFWTERGSRDGFERYINSKALQVSDQAMLLGTFEALHRLFKAGRDSIWRFVIRNVIRPYILSRGEPFDLVIGNPPWLSLRYIKSIRYQNFLKEEMRALGIKPKGAKLVTQLELATLFFAECVRSYLKNSGTIAFVMPRSVLIHRQHAEFMKFRFDVVSEVRCQGILDLNEVSPLFSVPACVLIAKKGERNAYPVPYIRFSGHLPRKNASWQEATKMLRQDTEQWSPAPLVSQPSPYLRSFHQGATIVPRRFWFVRLVADPRLGFDPEAPLLESDQDVPTKKPWNDYMSRGQVESQVIYGTALSTDILPFHCIRLRAVVLPIAFLGGKWVLLSSAAAFQAGMLHLGHWLEKAEATWAAKKTQKAPVQLAERVDYHGELKKQFSARKGRYAVLYVASARELAASVIDTVSDKCQGADGSTMTFARLIVDAKCYWYLTDSLAEAHFLCAWLNSQAVDDATRPRGRYGRYRERNIHKRPLEIGPPKFDPANPKHQDMANLAEQAAYATAALVPRLRLRSVGALRRAIRTHHAIAPIIKRIDKLCREIGRITI